MATGQRVGGVDDGWLAPVWLVDALDRPLVLLAAVTVAQATNGRADELSRVSAQCAYAVLVCLQEIMVYDQRKGGQEVAHLDTATTLAPYRAAWGGPPSSQRHLLTLAEAWLSDLCWGWSKDAVPGADALTECGLLELLRTERPRHVCALVDLRA